MEQSGMRNLIMRQLEMHPGKHFFDGFSQKDVSLRVQNLKKK